MSDRISVQADGHVLLIGVNWRGGGTRVYH